jgi:hypothetical protein
MSTGYANGRIAAQPATEEKPAPTLLDSVLEATRAAPRYTVQDVEVMASKAARSKLYGMDESQAFTLMMLAESKGLHPIQAMERYHIIQGRPSMRADAMQAEFNRIGGRVDWLETTDAKCIAVFYHPQLCPKGKTVTFTIQEARRANLTTKAIWNSYPANMLRARVISIGVRMVAPGVILGIYTPDEVSDESDWSSVSQGVAGPVADMPRDGHGPERTGQLRDFIEGELAKATTRLEAACLIAKVERPDLISGGRTQVANHLIKKWIADKALDPEDIRTNGKRDPNKIALALNTAWDDEQAEVAAEVVRYVEEKLAEAVKAAGITQADDGIDDWDDPEGEMGDDSAPAEDSPE